jgi:hypothetical protein
MAPKFDGDFVILDLKNLDSEYGAKASATVTFTGAPSADQTITIIATSGTGTLSQTYTAKATEDTDAAEFDIDGSANTCASLVRCIEEKQPNLSLDREDGELILTQPQRGTVGNTTITENLSNATKTNFSGGTGVDVPPPIFLNVKGPPSLRKNVNEAGNIPYIASNGGPALDLVDTTE